jgi:hypothetical protein
MLGMNGSTMLRDKRLEPFWKVAIVRPKSSFLSKADLQLQLSLTFQGV